MCTGLGAEMLVADIADPAVPELLLRTALERLGRCDVVINNAEPSK
jgi:NAD(P)-dependent dehydrogenase (short-subunit alcohol dehydrogenase family)